MPNLVFVYGTLLSDEYNNELLEGSKFIGPVVTSDLYTMFSNGSYPAITVERRYPIIGEVYEVDDTGLKVLDRLEGYVESLPITFYDRLSIPVRLTDTNETVTAKVYVMIPGEPEYRGMKRLEQGSFKLSKKL